MINTENMDAMSEYGVDNAYNTLPTGAEWTDGADPERTLPAAWWNAIMGLFSRNLNQSKDNFDNLIAELKGALALGGLTADGSTTQLATLFSRFVFGANDKAYTPLSNVDANTVVKAGFYNLTGTGQSNTPFVSGWAVLVIPASTDGAYLTQLAFDTGDTASAYIRKNKNNVWSSWQKLWNAGNDGAGSGLDSDLFDGIQSDRFLFGDSATASTLITDANAVTKPGLSRVSDTTLNCPETTYGAILTNFYDTQGGWQIYKSFNNGASLYFRVRVASTWQTWRKVWSDHNDGPGSGLDADTVDGKQASEFLQIAGDGNCIALTPGSDVLTERPTGFYMGSGLTNAPDSGWWMYRITKHNSLYRTIDAIPFTAVRGGFRGMIIDGNWSGWYAAWDASNDGPGSGLDADTVDGRQGSSFMYDNPAAITSGSVLAYFTHSGVFTAIATSTDQPSSHTYQYLVNFYDSNSVVVIATQTTSGLSYIRYKTGGVWSSSWIRLNSNLYTEIPVVTSDPTSPVVGQMWLRSDL